MFFISRLVVMVGVVSFSIIGSVRCSIIGFICVIFIGLWWVGCLLNVVLEYRKVWVFECIF